MLRVLITLLCLLPFSSHTDQFSDAVGAYANADFEKAYQLWNLLAENGNPGAMFDLGVLYWEGQGIAQNRSLAIQWWQRAAENNIAAAQYNLGLVYFLGEEVTTDTEKALALVQLAAEQQHDYARQILPALKNTVVETIEPKSDERLYAYSGANAGETSATIYSKDSTNAAVLGSLGVGTPIQVLSHESKWSRIKVPGGVLVWVSSQYIKSNDTQKIISGTGVRIRTKPSTSLSSSIAGNITNGTIVEVVGNINGWSQIRAPSSIEIWLPSNHIKFAKEETESWQKEWNQASIEQSVYVQESITPSTTDQVLDPKKIQSIETSSNKHTSSTFQAATVKAKIAEVVDDRRTRAQLLKLLTRDTPVRIIEQQMDWVRVKVPTGLYVWIYGKYLSEDTGQFFINTDHVRARSMPSDKQGSSVLGIFPKGANVTFIGSQGDWKRIKAFDFVTGWMHVDQLTLLNTITDDWQSKWSEY